MKSKVVNRLMQFTVGGLLLAMLWFAGSFVGYRQAFNRGYTAGQETPYNLEIFVFQTYEIQESIRDSLQMLTDGPDPRGALDEALAAMADSWMPGDPDSP